MQGNNATGSQSNGYRTNAGNEMNPNPMLYASANQEHDDDVDEANEVILNRNPVV